MVDMWLFNRWHRHKNLEDAIIELAKDVSTIRIAQGSIFAKLAVNEREKKRNLPIGNAALDAEVMAIQKQLGGDIIAVLDVDGRVIEGGN